MTEKDKEEDYKQLTNLREKYPHLKVIFKTFSIFVESLIYLVV